MVCSRFPNTIFLEIFPDLAFQPRLLYEFLFEGDGADRAAVIGLIRQGSQGWGRKQISLIVIRSAHISVPDRPLRVRSVRSGATGVARVGISTPQGQHNLPIDIKL